MTETPRPEDAVPQPPVAQPPVPPVPPPGAPLPPPAYRPDPNTVPYSLDVGFRWAWSKLTSNAAGAIVGALVLVAVSMIGAFIAMAGVFALMASGDTGTSDDLQLDPGSAAGITGIVLIVVGSLVSLLTAAYQGSAYTGGLLDIANGVPTTIGSFLRPRRFGTVLAVVLLQALAVLVGLLVFCVGGFVVAFFLMFTVFAVLDRNVGAVAGMKASASIVRHRIGDALVLWLVVMVLSMFLGILAYPFVQLLTVFAYRRLADQPVAP
ncbi:hypothetical protein [Gordonia sp. (in: high G+C Gram-positive bacteria)]|uniref:hypothetical protein n=1 Tax=Gordonia sp. (in: high G+C Gram-positive bacteria) TaxID=84139 RepID=UPI0039E4F019